jgi:hypothetical protein
LAGGLPSVNVPFWTAYWSESLNVCVFCQPCVSNTRNGPLAAGSQRGWKFCSPCISSQRSVPSFGHSPEWKRYSSLGFSPSAMIVGSIGSRASTYMSGPDSVEMIA